MSSYAEIQAQIADLQRQAAEARATEIAAAKLQIRNIMTNYGLTLDDLRGIASNKVSKPRQSVAPKYRDPSTGETWTGRGRSPRWLDGKNKEDFLIKDAQ